MDIEDMNANDVAEEHFGHLDAINGNLKTIAGLLAVLVIMIAFALYHFW